MKTDTFYCWTEIFIQQNWDRDDLKNKFCWSIQIRLLAQTEKPSKHQAWVSSFFFFKSWGGFNRFFFPSKLVLSLCFLPSSGVLVLSRAGEFRFSMTQVVCMGFLITLITHGSPGLMTLFNVFITWSGSLLSGLSCLTEVPCCQGK